MVEEEQSLFRFGSRAVEDRKREFFHQMRIISLGVLGLGIAFIRP